MVTQVSRLEVQCATGGDGAPALTKLVLLQPRCSCGCLLVLAQWLEVSTKLRLLRICQPMARFVASLRELPRLRSVSLTECLWDETGVPGVRDSLPSGAVLTVAEFVGTRLGRGPATLLDVNAWVAYDG
eukprot:jgi/Ulvmu1/9455/UM052_0021.1